VTVKDDVLRQGEHVHTKTEAADVNVKIEQLREEWVGIENDLSKERGRLEKIMRLWNDYERKQEEMYEWLSGILSSLRVLEHQEKTIDVVKSQISLIQVCDGRSIILLIDVNECINNECVECVLPQLYMGNRFTHSHPSKGENRTRNHNESCKCKRTF
jgi:hypothetical protein